MDLGHDLAAEPPLGGGPANNLEPAHAAARVEHHGAAEQVIAARHFDAGETIFAFDALAWWPMRDAFTVEHPCGQHFFDPRLASVAHSCEPNARVSFTRMALVARRAIAPGEALSFDYLTTESAIAAPFACDCGASRCRGWIGRPDLPRFPE